MAHSSRVGLALGGGSARGWAHIGVIDALAERGIVPGIVCGTSVGALVGASYVTGRHQALRDWALSIERRDVLAQLDIRITRGGLIEGKRVRAVLEKLGITGTIEGCPIPFAAVATDLAKGREVWIKDGPVVDAVRASIAIPGIFSPVRSRGMWLVDGGLVNPVPVSVCRALGADIVIAVDLNADLVGRRFVEEVEAPGGNGAHLSRQEIADLLRERLPAPMKPLEPFVGRLLGGETRAPGYFQVLANSLNIMQDRITRTRLAGDPPDILLRPRLAGISMMDYHRATEIIAEGWDTVEREDGALRRIELDREWTKHP